MTHARLCVVKANWNNKLEIKIVANQLQAMKKTKTSDLFECSIAGNDTMPALERRPREFG